MAPTAMSRSDRGGGSKDRSIGGGGSSGTLSTKTPYGIIKTSVSTSMLPGLRQSQAWHDDGAPDLIDFAGESTANGSTQHSSSAGHDGGRSGKKQRGEKSARRRGRNANQRSYSSLMRAAADGDDQAVLELVGEPTTDLFATDRSGRTALEWAVIGKHESVKVLC